MFQSQMKILVYNQKKLIEEFVNSKKPKETDMKKNLKNIMILSKRNLQLLIKK